MYKSKYRNYIEKQPSDHEDLMVIKIRKEAVGHSKDIFVFIVYVKPVRETESLFNVIEHNLEKYSQLGSTLILGDFNARTGDLSDTDTMNVSLGELTTLPSDLTQFNNDIPNRQNCDRKINERGRELIDLCKTTNHIILNGRFLGDSMGYFTFMNDNGCSVVDYALADTELFKRVMYIKVSPLIHISDHCIYH